MFLVQPIGDQFAVEHGAVIQAGQVRPDRRRYAAAPVMTDKQQRLIDAIPQQRVLFRRGQWRLGDPFGQGVRLKDHVAIGLRIILPELGAEEFAGQSITASQGQAMRQAHIGATQQTVEDITGEAAGHCRRLDEMLVDTPRAMQATQRIDQRRIPAGMHDPEAAGIKVQR